MTILISVIAFIISLLSGLGVGGGGLFIVYLALFTETPQLAAQGYNLLFFLFSAGASLPVHLFKRKILFPAIITMIIAGIFGALAGSYLSAHINENILRKIFGAMLAVSGTFSMRKLLFSVKNPQKKRK